MAPKSNLAPYRKIIGHCLVAGLLMECLECGHIVRPQQKATDKPSATRRRCRRCKHRQRRHFVGYPPETMTYLEHAK